MARTAKRYLEQTKPHSVKSTVMKVGIYARLSVDVEEQKGESIENQIELMQQHIKSENQSPNNSMELVVYDTYIDKGITGTHFQREGFERMMQDVRAKHIQCIMVKDFSRFGRDYIETGNYIEKILPFMGVRFIAVADHFDSMAENAGNKNLAVNIKNLVNDMYAKDISKRIVMAKHNAMEKGEYIGTVPPYGYVVERINGKRTLVVDKEPAKIVRLIFELYYKGTMISDIVKILYQKKVHRIKEYKQYRTVYCEENQTLYQWADTTIHTLLYNEVYLGKLVQGKYYIKAYTGNKKSKKALEEELVVIENTHIPIIGETIFPKKKITSNNVEGNQERKEMKHADSEDVFQDVIYCGDCGKKLKATSRIKEGVKYRYGYYCKFAYYLDQRKCKRKYVTTQKMEEIFLLAVHQEFSHLKLRAKDVTAINRRLTDEQRAFYQKDKLLLESKQEKEQYKLSELYMEYKEGILTKKAYEMQKKQNQLVLRKLSTNILEIEKKQAKLEVRSESLNVFLRSLFKVKKKEIDSHLVQALVDRIDVYSSGEITIHFKFKGGDFNVK